MANRVDNGDKRNSHSSFHDDIYGQLITREIPELLSSSVLDLDTALEKIPDVEKTAWATALEKCPELCGDPFKLMFLRFAHFHCDRAAERIVAYWTKRLELFSPSKAFLPMILGPNGAMKDDDKTLNIGFLCLVPKSDDAGHPILFADPSKFPANRDHPSIVRAFWYHVHAALESEDGQKKGLVVVIYAENSSFSQFDTRLLQVNVQSIKNCLPVRMSAFHICHPPTYIRIVIPFIKILMGEKLRKRIKIHTGKQKKVIEKLEGKYGIPQQNLPTEIGGGVILNQEEWLQRRQEIGL